MYSLDVPGLEPNKCYIDDDGIIVTTFHGVYTKETDTVTNEAQLHGVNKLHAEGKPALCLYDMTDMDNLSASGMKAAFISCTKSIPYDKEAFLCRNGSKVGSLVKMVLRLDNSKRGHYFDDTDKARAWLLEIF
jgi:hypothetical protein